MSAVLGREQGTHLDVDGPSVCAFLLTMLGWNGGMLPVFVDGVRAWEIDCDRPGLVAKGAALWERARVLDERRSVQVELGLPRHEGRLERCAVLWAWVKGSDPLRRAARFRPVPALVARVGASSERLMMWGLRETVHAASVAEENERIAYALHAPRTRCEPGLLRIPIPGLFMRLERSRPVPVVATRLGITDYACSQVTAVLKRPPPRDAWMQHR